MSRPEFDRQRIVIRKRSILEVADLALGVVRREGLRIIPLALMLIVPFFLINFFLLRSLLSSESLVHPETWFSEDFGTAFFNNGDYFFRLWLLMILEADFVFAPVTAYLGDWFFRPPGELTVRGSLRRWRSSLGQLLWSLLLWRPFTFFRKYLPQIILLEKTPFWGGKNRPIPTRKRSSNFHRGLFGEGLPVLLLEAIIFLPGVYLLEQALGLFVSESAFRFHLYIYVLLPMYGWSILLFNAVFRFCAYLNHRIIREGWDVELAAKELLSELGGEEAVREQERFLSGTADAWAPDTGDGEIPPLTLGEGSELFRTEDHGGNF